MVFIFVTDHRRWRWCTSVSLCTLIHTCHPTNIDNFFPAQIPESGLGLKTGCPGLLLWEFKARKISGSLIYSGFVVHGIRARIIHHLSGVNWKAPLPGWEERKKYLCFVSSGWPMFAGQGGWSRGTHVDEGFRRLNKHVITAAYSWLHYICLPR